MLGLLTRGAYMAILALMIAAYAMQVAKSDASEAQASQQEWRIYS